MDITLILVAAVSLSLILSIVSLILQILRGRSSNKAPKSKTKANSQNSPPSSPAQGAGFNPYPPQAAQAWRPPAAPVQQSNHTEPLFSAAQRPFAMGGGGTEQLQSGGYQIHIQESSPNGQRSYEIMVTGEFPVGRSASGGLQIEHSTVSGLQCVLIAGPDSVFVSNRSNSNVTRLNGVKLEDTRPLKPGDTLSLGNIQLALLDIRKL